MGGFIFCHSTAALQDARDSLAEFVVPAAAKAGVTAPKDVMIPAGPSGLEPSQTSFFQALNIPTKIVKGAIEITADFKICQVYQDGAVFDAAVLDIDDAVLMTKFMTG